jgi:predicted enzyme related to lactoylglutathione lyase
VGTVALVELRTPDPGASTDFYHRLFGWDMTDLGLHLLAEAGSLRAAVVHPLQPSIGDSVMPSEWSIGFRVENLRRATERVVDLGGDILEPPTESPDGWRVTQAIDPTGGAFALIEAGPSIGVTFAGTAPGTVGWCELESTDPALVTPFYRDLFGWGVVFDTTTAYTTFTADGQPMAGVRRRLGDGNSRWVPYFTTADLGHSTTLARTSGAQVGPKQRYEQFRFAKIEDPDGAVFALIETRPIDAADENPVGLADRIAELVREGNRHHIVVSDRAGNRIVEIPVTIGLLGAAVAPVASAAGTVAALAARWRFSVVTPEN